MSDKTKVKVKVKRRKLKIKRILILFFLLISIILIGVLLSKVPIKNIYIVGNNILSDKTTIENSGLSNYPPILRISKKEIRKKLGKNPYIKNIKIEKKFPSKIYVYVTERKILCSYQNELYLEDGIKVENIYNITSVPILTSDISSIYNRFTEKFNLINNEILLKISEISYVPNEVDNERFLINMNDGNLIYITLSKITKINKYNSIYSELDGKNGIIYLDSGDYIELKEE